MYSGQREWLNERYRGCNLEDCSLFTVVRAWDTEGKKMKADEDRAGTQELNHNELCVMC